MRVLFNQVNLFSIIIFVSFIPFTRGRVDNSIADVRFPSKSYTEWKWKTSGRLPLNTSFVEVVILAREEAKCLQDFGTAVNFQQKYSAFQCSPASSNYSLCIQCTTLTQTKRNKQDCADFCANEIDGTCLNKCILINQVVNSELKEMGINIEKLRAKNFAVNNSIIDHLNYNQLRNIKDTKTSQAFSFQVRNSIADENVSRIIQFPQVFCEGVTYMEHNKTILNSTPISFGVMPTNENKKLGQNHFIILQWRLGPSVESDQSNTSLNSSRNKSFQQKDTDFNAINHNSSENNVNQNDNMKINIKSIPIIFVVQSFSQKQSAWTTVAKRFELWQTIYDLQIVDVAYLSDVYKWRITAIGPEGIVDEVVTDNYTTLDGYITPGPPKRMYVIKTSVNENSTGVLIGWDPPKENACFYKIVLESYDGEERQKHIRIKESPLGVHRHWFENLRFGTKYSIRITTRDPRWNFYESSLTQLIFKTPTCLQSHNYRFDKCAPTPPQNITASNLNTKISVGDIHPFIVEIKWFPPVHTSIYNQIEKYVVQIKTLSLGLQNRTSAKSLGGNMVTNNFQDYSWNTDNFRQNITSLKPIIVPGNTTKVIVDNLQVNSEYTIMITAISSKGHSPAALFHLHTKYSVPKKVVTPVHMWLYLFILATVKITALLSCHLSTLYFRKRKAQMTRNRYFQSMEERDTMPEDWALVTYTNVSPELSHFGDSFPLAKWEILYENLSLGDIIGHGAFGVVRRATIHSEKLQAILKYGQLINNLDTKDEANTDIMTVAVKMLKVSATRDDGEHLLKEILTMQNLGYHPQIVGLLGACTKGRTLCLVLEYCAGGDLLTFLRQIRSTYWPTMGLIDPKNCSLATNLNSNNSEKRSFASLPIYYADMETFSNHFSSPLVKNSVGRKDYGERREIGSGKQSDITPLERTVFSETVEVRPIDEKDILSYACQIAMGMQYLEINHIVHRDLACRNVLLLGDNKRVKISDFGLSRDVYTWNVYHQKSNEKLPIKWMAVESIFTNIFTRKSDVWSFGIVIWELVTLGGTPYPGVDNTELFRFLKCGYRMERPDNCSEELYALMKKCWRTDSIDRPNFTELRQYLEIMIESNEPNIYLSLKGKLPSDFYHLSSRTDVQETFGHVNSISEDSMSGIKDQYLCRRQKRSYKTTTFGDESQHTAHRRKKTLKNQGETSSAKLTEVVKFCPERLKSLPSTFHINAPKSSSGQDSQIQRKETRHNECFDRIGYVGEVTERKVKEEDSEGSQCTSENEI